MNQDEYPQAYRELRGRVIDLVRDLDEEQVNAVAPATPQWRVRDIVAHVTGVCADVLDGNLDGVATDDWTDKQVTDRRDRPFADVLAEWEEKGAAIDAAIPDFPEIAAGQMIADATTHEQDIRGALEARGGRDSAALDIAFRWGAGVLDGSEPLRLESEVGPVIVGEGDPVATVRASRFDFVRSYTGRRSLDQMKAFDWDGEPRPERLVLMIFSPRETPLVE
jgi:uncharacterized protein (TIGR03083 family)